MASKTQRWVIGGAAVLAVLLLISEHNYQSTRSGSDTSGTNAARPCTVTVTADVLNARSRPDGNAPVVDTYRRGEVVTADRTTQNGFRQLQNGRWAAQEYLQPTSGSDCG